MKKTVIEGTKVRTSWPVWALCALDVAFWLAAFGATLDALNVVNRVYKFTAKQVNQSRRNQWECTDVAREMQAGVPADDDAEDLTDVISALAASLDAAEEDAT